MTQAPVETPCQLVLGRPQDSRLGRALALRAGDALIAVNGLAFSAGADALRQQFRNRAGKRLVLTFQRGDAQFPVLCHSPNLGDWQNKPLPDPAPQPLGGALDPDRLVNWQFYAGVKGDYDVAPQETSLLALFCPPVWLLKMHLWQEFSAFVVAMMVCAAVSPWIAVFAYLAAAVLLLQQGAQLFGNDRSARGYALSAVIASGTENEAHRIYQKLHPKARFIYAVPNASPVPAETA